MIHCYSMKCKKGTGEVSFNSYISGFDNVDTWYFSGIKEVRRAITEGGLIEIEITGYDSSQTYVMDKLGNLAESKSFMDCFGEYSKRLEVGTCSFGQTINVLNRY